MTATTGQPSTFRVGLVQMRSGRVPSANIDAAVKLIARSQSRRRGLCADAGDDQHPGAQARRTDGRDRAGRTATLGLATFQELARTLSIWLHIGSLAIKASPDRAANRSFLINPKGDIAARYDKIHMFDVDLAGGESYRESAQL